MKPLVKAGLILGATACIALGLLAYELRGLSIALERGDVNKDTIWASARLITGPTSAVAAGLHRLPALGISGRPFSDITEQRTFVRLMRIRYPNIPESSFFIWPRSYEAELIQLCRELSLREDDARYRFDTLWDQEARQQAYGEWQDIVRFKEFLGVPERRCD